MKQIWFCYEQWHTMPPTPVLYHRWHPETFSKTVVKNTVMKVPEGTSLKEAEKLFQFQTGGGDFVRP